MHGKSLLPSVYFRESFIGRAGLGRGDEAHVHAEPELSPPLCVCLVIMLAAYDSHDVIKEWRRTSPLSLLSTTRPLNVFFFQPADAPSLRDTSSGWLRGTATYSAVEQTAKFFSLFPLLFYSSSLLFSHPPPSLCPLRCFSFFAPGT